MASNSLLVRDLAIILRGAKKICAAALDIQANKANTEWENSSLKPLAAKSFSSVQQMVVSLSEADIKRISKETAERISVVASGLNAYIKTNVNEIEHATDTENTPIDTYAEQVPHSSEQPDGTSNPITNIHSKEIPISTERKKVAGDDFSVITDSLHSDANGFVAVSDEELDAINIRLSEVHSKILSQNVDIFEGVTDSLTDTKEQKFSEISNSFSQPVTHTDSAAALRPNSVTAEEFPSLPPRPTLIGRKPISKNKVKSTLSSDAKARKVPHSQLGRLMSFGRLGAGLAAGTVAEMTRRTVGGAGAKSNSLSDSSPFLTEANAKRIVDTLCSVRGAALKIGQMLSLTDNTFINPTLQKIFERVRQSADFMPAWQLTRTLESSLGKDWRQRVASFDEKPFAAASIGQVHEAVLLDGRVVALKIQYPGVADGIESDINNLVSTLKFANIFPEGLYVDEAIRVAKKELRWECDYKREKACTLRFKQLLQPYDDYYIPDVIDELCTDDIFTTELIEGVAVDKCVDMDQKTRDHICTLIMRLCLMEVFQFGFMQTDPNWANFFYNEETKQIALLDFGACREYKKEFVDSYIKVIHGAAKKDRQQVLEYSQKLSFLTGYEAKVMEEAHIDAVMTLGEAFQSHEPFDFASQDTTHRIHKLIPVMLDHRMCPPPEESYSLHRKMSGVFLLCAKLRGRIQCKSYFDNLYDNYTFGGNWK